MRHPRGVDLISADDVGPVSLNRMTREGVLTSVGPGWGAPLDLPVIRADRARPLVGIVPSHTVVSSLAGLWIHAGGRRPRILDLVGERGLHRTPPGTHPPGWILRFHSGAAAFEPADILAGVRVAAPSRCIVDALRWGDLGVVFPVVIEALRKEIVTRDEVTDVIGRENPRGRGASRSTNAWEAIDRVLEPP